jgi:hypothetical protein
VTIPKSATEITLNKRSYGHRIRFHVEESKLLEWMSDVAIQHASDDKIAMFTLDESTDSNQMENYLWHSSFGDLSWTMPDDLVRYDGYHSRRGAGIDVWYSPKLKVGFARCNYW